MTTTTNPTTFTFAEFEAMAKGVGATAFEDHHWYAVRGEFVALIDATDRTWRLAGPSCDDEWSDYCANSKEAATAALAALVEKAEADQKKSLARETAERWIENPKVLDDLAISLNQEAEDWDDPAPTTQESRLAELQRLAKDNGLTVTVTGIRCCCNVSGDGCKTYSFCTETCNYCAHDLEVTRGTPADCIAAVLATRVKAEPAQPKAAEPTITVAVDTTLPTEAEARSAVVAERIVRGLKEAPERIEEWANGMAGQLAAAPAINEAGVEAAARVLFTEYADEDWEQMSVKQKESCVSLATATIEAYLNHSQPNPAQPTTLAEYQAVARGVEEAGRLLESEAAASLLPPVAPTASEAEELESTLTFEQLKPLVIDPPAEMFTEDWSSLVQPPTPPVLDEAAVEAAVVAMHGPTGIDKVNYLQWSIVCMEGMRKAIAAYLAHVQPTPTAEAVIDDAVVEKAAKAGFDCQRLTCKWDEVEESLQLKMVSVAREIVQTYLSHAVPQPTTHAAISVVALQQKLEQANVRETMLTREKDELRKQRDALKKQLREQFFAFAEGLAKWKKELDEEGAAVQRAATEGGE